MSDAVLRFTILGCGSSPGVPRIGNDWGACDPKNPKNRRRRASLLVERVTHEGTTTVVIDTGPDFREQMIDAQVGWADAVLYTHPHADHIHGIDDLRSFVINRRERVQIWCDEPTSERLHASFDYCFTTPEGSNYPPILVENRIEPYRPVRIEGPGGAIEALPYVHPHGTITSLGFRFGKFAYSSDVSDFDDRALPYLQDLDVLVIDALQPREHPSHLSLSQAVDWVGRIDPKRAVLTHMHTPLDYEATLRATPGNVEPAYDGMTIELAD